MFLDTKIFQDKSGTTPSILDPHYASEPNIQQKLILDS